MLFTGFNSLHHHHHNHTKKFMKRVGFLEKILSSKRNVVSGFGLGVGILFLVFSLIFLNNSLNSSFFNPMFQGSNVAWPFSFSSTASSSSSPSLELHMGEEEQRVEEFMERSESEIFLSPKSGNYVSVKTHEGNLFKEEKNSSFLASNGGKSVTEKNHEEKKDKNRSFHSEEGLIVGDKSNIGNPSVEVNRRNKEGAISMKTHGGNLSEKSKNSSFLVSNGGKVVTEETHEENFKYKKEKNGSFHSEEGKVGEEMHQGNLSGKVDNVKSEKTHEAKSVETHKENLHEKHKLASSSIDLRDMNRIDNHSMKCDIFDGRWVRDDKRPYYPAGSCPHIDRDFDCHLNGRRDDEFLRWRWQPNQCQFPSLNATDFLERMRGKRLLLVGDSLNRNMWESLVCILGHSILNKSKKVYEITGRKDFKRKGSYSFRFEDYNCSIDFVSAPFLVKPSHFHGRNGLMETLRLDLMDQSSPLYRDSDVIVFNSGHWWTHEKTSKGENYYQEGNHVYPKLEALKAYKKALTTWAKWIDKNIDLNRTQVFFRGYSLTHFRGGQWNSGGQCHKETEPIFNETYLEEYPSKMKVLERVLQKMKTPVVYLNISKLTDYRKDAHPSIYRKKYKTVEEQIAAEMSQDCSHWCLPGVPDTWNELLYASLLMSGIGSWRN